MSYFKEMYEKRDLNFIIKDRALQIIENFSLYENEILPKSKLLKEIHEDLIGIITVEDINLLKNKFNIIDGIGHNRIIEKILLVDSLGQMEENIYKKIMELTK